jgi:hypothetical protein
MTRTIGKSASDRIGALRTLVSRIPDGGSAECATLLGTVERKLEEVGCTLSIVGQVKAGKSTLINALTEVGELLPTEVNPWTAVITNLHFGRPGHAPGTAEFALFSEEEWARMLTGDEETRKLAQDFLPGYDPEILKEQVRAMQANARARLGEMYHHLLGRTHRFSKVDRATLDRYVCAGDGADGEVVAGRLSGITKSADIYLAPGPFALPVTVVDTPGINDPFLVRDEITTGHLKTADVSLVAISAHQPMNEADIALLRMLARQSARKVVVFVNRCDELGLGITRVPAMLDDLRARLTDAIGAERFALCAGSAMWGLVALRGSDAEVAETLRGDAFAALQGGTVPSAPARARELLAAASGLGALRAEVSRLLHDGPVAECAAEIEGQARVALGLVRQRIDAAIAHEKRILEAGPGGLREATIEKLATRRDACVALAGRLAAMHAEWAEGFEVRVAEAQATLAHGLEDAVSSYIRIEQEALARGMERDSGVRRWAFNYECMRDYVDERTAGLYEATRAEVDAEAQAHALAVNAEVAALMGGVDLGGLGAALPGATVVPGFKPGSKIVEVDLAADASWRFWSTRRIDADAAAERLAGLLRAEVARAERATAETLRRTLEARTEAARAFLLEVVAALDANLRAEAERLEDDLRQLRSGGASAPLEARLAARAATLEKLERDAAELAKVRDALDAVRTEDPARISNVA